MAFPKFGDMIRFNTATIGQGTMDVGTVYSVRYLTPADTGLATGSKVIYKIEQGDDFEIGEGTYTDAVTDTVSRDTVFVSKIGGSVGTAKITLAGAANVRLLVSARDLQRGLNAYFGVFPAAVSLASGATTDLGAQDSLYVDITGNTTITSFGATASGVLRVISFTTALILTYNATSLKIPGASSLVTTVGDRAIVRSLGSGNWEVVNYIRAAGQRERIASSRDYFVSTTGSDTTGTGLIKTSIAATFTNGSTSVGITAHGLAVGDNMYFTTTGGLPTNFSTSRIYYVKTVPDANTVTLATTSGGTAISAGSAGTGTHTAVIVSPFLTIQKAVDTVATLDINGQVVTIKVAYGAYNAIVNLRNVVGFAAQGNLIILGDTAISSNVSIQTTSQSCFRSDNLNTHWNIYGFKLSTVTSGICIQAAGGGKILFDNIEFGATGQFHLYATGGGSKVGITGNLAYNITGGGDMHAYANQGGYVEIFFAAVTITGTPAFATAFVQSDLLGSIQAISTVYTGAATGKRYNILSQGMISSGGGGANFFPGNVAGTNDGTGIYS